MTRWRDKILVFYGSSRMISWGVRLADFIVEACARGAPKSSFRRRKGHRAADARRMYKSTKGQAPAPLESLSQKIIAADAFVSWLANTNGAPRRGGRI